jgi:PAS domain S-box-containing protein
MLSPLKSAEGILVTAAIRNITVRKAADENQARTTRELTLKHQLLDAVVEGTTDPVYVRDLEGRFILANSAVARVFGLGVKEVLGKSLRELLPNESADVVFQSDQEIVRTGVTRTVEDVAEIDGITRLFVTTKGPYRDADQTIIGTIGIAREITEQRKQEEARVEELIRDISVRKAAAKHLAQMEGRYRGLLEAAPDAMVVVNPAGEIVLLNVQAEKQFGYRRDELVGQRVKNIIPQGFAERLLADGLRSVEDALAQQIGTGIELIGRRKDGSDFPIEIMLSPLESADGILVTAAVRDISVRKAAEARLRQKMEELNRSNEELEQFAYIASHDLQEPLRMVASYTQLLSRRYTGKLDADADEFIAFAVDGASRMQSLIQDLLTYSRVATKGRDLLQTSSQEALQHALTNLRGAIEKSGALVTHDSLPTVLADETQLVQLFQNLVGNAIKYQNPGVPRVHVSAARNGGKKWVFSVKDNGLGIEPQYFDKIFGMFQRLHRRDQFEGTGIGLAICKKIVERHGGHILLESRLGHGSTFRFALAGSEGQS